MKWIVKVAKVATSQVVGAAPEIEDTAAAMAVDVGEESAGAEALDAEAADGGRRRRAFSTESASGSGWPASALAST